MLFYQVGSVLAASLVLSACQFTAAFRSSIFDLKLPTLPFGDKALHATRRDILEKASLSSLGTALASLSLSLKAEASGGATAGGAYLLSVRIHPVNESIQLLSSCLILFVDFLA